MMRSQINVVVNKLSACCCLAEEIPGCFCPDGMLVDIDSEMLDCVTPEQCHCIYDNTLYNNGDKLELRCSEWSVAQFHAEFKNKSRIIKSRLSSIIKVKAATFFERHQVRASKLIEESLYSYKFAWLKKHERNLNESSF